MFEREVVGDEVFFEMQDNLKKIASEKASFRLSKRAEALSLLSKAAENLDSLGMNEFAESVVRIMEISAIEKKEKIQKEAQVQVKIEDDSDDFLSDIQSKEEDELYNAYMSDPDVEIAVSVDDTGEDGVLIPTSKQLAGLWD
jgi:hypothetical protein